MGIDQFCQERASSSRLDQSTVQQLEAITIGIEDLVRDANSRQRFRDMILTCAGMAANRCTAEEADEERVREGCIAILVNPKLANRHINPGQGYVWEKHLLNASITGWFPRLRVKNVRKRSTKRRPVARRHGQEVRTRKNLEAWRNVLTDPTFCKQDSCPGIAYSWETRILDEEIVGWFRSPTPLPVDPMQDMRFQLPEVVEDDLHLLPGKYARLAALYDAFRPHREAIITAELKEEDDLIAILPRIMKCASFSEIPAIKSALRDVQHDLGIHHARTATPTQPEAVIAKNSPKQQRKTTNRSKGRPVDTDPLEDERIHDAWKLGTFDNLEEFALARRRKKRDVQLAIDRHRKRKERS